MAARGSRKREWVLEVEKLLEADPMLERCRSEQHCIYRVPLGIKERNPGAYRPQLVSLGPFHHGDMHLQPMEEHKERVMLHLLRRCKKPLEALAVAMEEVMEQLQSAYMDLDEKWLDGCGREKFLKMMIVDGCFLLEVMRATDTALWGFDKVYVPIDDDTMLSSRAILSMVPYIRHDMLILENQLPLLLFKRLVAVVETYSRHPPNDDFINSMVLRFLSSVLHEPMHGIALGLHPLDVYRRRMLYGPYPPEWQDRLDVRSEADIAPSATELHEAGIRFERSTMKSLYNIRFRDGVLTMPTVYINDSIEYQLLNIIAFEWLHADAGKEVTAYVFFMNSLVRSGEDAALLSSKGIIQSALGSDRPVARLLDDICRDVAVKPQSALDDVYQQMIAHCRKPLNRWRASIIHNYFRSPTSFINFVAASTILLMTIVQTICAIVSLYKQQG